MNFNVISPKNESELFEAMRNNLNGFRFGAGYTDLILEIKKQDPKSLIVINLAQLNDDYFNSFTHDSDSLIMGSLVNVASIENDAFIKQNFPVLHQASKSLASAQIRQVATVGGNICTASPSGDVSCALVAINASCEVMNVEGITRIIPIRNFFVSPRHTGLQKDEILRRIIVPLSAKNQNIHSGFIKIGTRRSMECSVVSLSYHICYDHDGIITNAGIAIGAVAPTIRFTEHACDFLIDKNIHAMDLDLKSAFAERVLEYSSPISDIRASTWYRTEVLRNISKGLFDKI